MENVDLYCTVGHYDYNMLCANFHMYRFLIKSRDLFIAQEAAFETLSLLKTLLIQLFLANVFFLFCKSVTQ